MKSHLCILFSFVAFAAPVMATDTKPGPEEVVVAVMKQPFPSDEKMRAEFLWTRFANKPEEEKFKSYESENWQETYVAFADALVKKAGAQGLDSASLRKVLDQILKGNDKTAYLPVGAYQTTLDGNPVWIVIVKWEFPHSGAGLGHVRMFAFDQKTLKSVGFNTCM